MRVINLYGGAGAGKSTLASNLFSRLRFDNEYNVELVPEFAKDVVYEGGKRNLSDQLYLLGNQQHRLWRLKEQGIELAICDSPIDLSLAYWDTRGLSHLHELKVLVEYIKSQYTEFNVFVSRQKQGSFRKNNEWSTKIDRNLLENKIFDVVLSFDLDGADLLYRRVVEWMHI